MEVTSHSQKFQVLFDEISSKLAKTNQLGTFSGGFRVCKTDEERVKYVLEIDLINEILKSKIYHKPKLKCATFSEKFRVEGNLLFKNKKFNAALGKYTESVLSAPCIGEITSELAMALANRSAVLYHMQDFQGCLADVKMALSQGYPEKLRYKLLERAGRCYLKVGNHQLATEMFADVNHCLPNSSLPAEKQNQIILECEKLLKSASNDPIETSPSYCTKAPVLETPDLNSTYPCALSSFDIQVRPDLGRFAVAARDIKAGELILFEKPFCSVLCSEQRLTHCHYCLKRANNLIGCSTCSSVGFCNLECREFAMSEYHRIECSFIDLLYQSDAGFGHLSLRMIIKAGFENLIKWNKTNSSLERNDHDISEGLNRDGVYDSLSYVSIHSLIGHSYERSLSDLFRRTVLAVYLLRFIEDSPFFINDSFGIPRGKKRACIGGHLLKQLQMLPCNAHEVSELKINKSNIALSELEEIGSAIYATLSLLNHSCDPSVVRHSYGSSCALRAMKNIPKGGESIDNYGTLYPVSSYENRQSILNNQYYFTCSCKACVERWPLYSSIPDGSPVFICPTCSSVVQSISISDTDFMFCSSCSVKLPITKDTFDSSRKQYLIAMDNVLDGQDPKENLPNLLNHLQLMSDCVELPWQEFNNCQEIVKQCFSMLGNHYCIEEN